MIKTAVGNTSAAKNLKWLGIASIVLGLLAISAPLATGLSIAMLVGVLVMLGGAARMIWAFRAGGVAPGLFQLALGFLTMVCGVILLTDPILASGFLTVLLAIYLLVDGVSEIGAALQARPRSGWGWLLFGGILSLLLGLMIWRQFPLAGSWAIGLALGFKLIMSGAIMLGVRRVVTESD